MVKLAVLVFPLAVSAELFTASFAAPSAAWRHGNSLQPVRDGTLQLMPHEPEVTLCGTAVHPDNLEGAEAELDILFDKPQQKLTLVWGKPFEWDRPEAGRGSLVITSNGVYKIRLTAGYFSMSASGFQQKWGETVRVRRFSLEHSGARKPLTEKERHAETQRWAAHALDRADKGLDALEKHIAEETAAGRWGAAADVKASPALIQTGESVTLAFSFKGDLPADSNVLMTPDFLSESPGETVPLKLNWRKETDGSRASVRLEPGRTGMWQIRWTVGGKELSRTFAVIDERYLVCRLLVTNDGYLRQGKPSAADAAHELGLPVDYWGGSEWGCPGIAAPQATLELFRIFADNRNRWGDSSFPLCNANWMFPLSPDFNLVSFDDALIVRGVKQTSRLWDLLGIGPMKTFGSYTYKHSVPKAVREAGGIMIDSLVQWQNWRDGGTDNHWLINHCGAPTVPYFVADDDFRKVAPGQSTVAFTQGTTSSIRLYYINFLEGQPQLNFQRRRPREDMAEVHNIDRFETAVDLWLNEVRFQNGPMFVSVGLENFVRSDDWNGANRLGIRYLARKAKTRRIVFVRGEDVGEYYLRHFKRQPENWFYWPDVYAGLRMGHKPHRVPDNIELSNHLFHSLHVEGEALPKFLWDFTRPWNEPEWDDQKTIRRKYGQPSPDELTPDNTVPRVVDLRKVRVEVKQADGEIRITLETAEPLGALPVAVWKLPFDADTVKADSCPRGARFIPMTDGSSGNLHGVAVIEKVPAGKTEWVIGLKGGRRPVRETLFTVGPVSGRSFRRDDGAEQAYLWLEQTLPYGGELRIPALSGAVHYGDGSTEAVSNGVLRVRFTSEWFRESPRLSGVPREQLLAAKFEPFVNFAAAGHVTVSSTFVEGNGKTYPIKNALDGNPETFWSSRFSDPQQVTVDFGQSRTFSRVSLHWEAPAEAYTVSVSADGQAWREVHRLTNGAGWNRQDTVTIAPATARFVRFDFIRRVSKYGYAIREIGLFE